MTGCYEAMKCAFHLETQFSPTQQPGVAFGAVRKESWLRYHALELKLHYFSSFGGHIWHSSLQGVKVKVLKGEVVLPVSWDYCATVAL